MYLHCTFTFDYMECIVLYNYVDRGMQTWAYYNMLMCTCVGKWGHMVPILDSNEEMTECISCAKDFHSV